ncbi:sulfotransferase family protein [Demequina subtropica]|uniref:sulfotransferase family protein n=1 Tax=Demequina subtropica TaxID=1638989 RepID=UPI0007867D71|nr:sulfotransferase [Demequina subtropica]
MKAFVIGTGRSGTHWTGFILGEHPEVTTTIEEPKIMRLATLAAQYRKRRPVYLPALRARYMMASAAVKTRVHADKSHPVIWYADKVARWFPDSKFIGINRSPFGVVASMVVHEGVLEWQDNWEHFGVPNEFLGITEDNVEAYRTMSPAGRAATRWLSHRQRMDELEGLLGDRLLVLDYEDMIDRYEENVARIWEFLELDHVDADAQAPKASSRDNWREVLSAEQIAEVSAITGVPVPAL